MIKNVPGVYEIFNTVSKKRYVGSTTIGVIKRWNDHKSQLRTNKHPNIHLQRSWNKHGSEAFQFRILEVCINVLEREQFYIDTLKPEYNIQPLAVNSKGVKRSKETCLKIGITKLGNTNKLGMTVTKEVRDTISKKLKAKYQSGELIHPMLGKTHKKASLKKLSKAKIGNSIRKNNPTYRGFIQIDKETKLELRRFETAREAADYVQQYSKPSSSKIIRACRENRLAYGYFWKFENVQVKSDELLEA